MKLGTSTLLSIALGALLIAAPGLDHVGGGVSYDQAFAAKGGNGKGNGKAGGSSASSAGGQSASKGGKGKSDEASDGSTEGTSVASLTGSGKKTKGPDHPSSLGRWNATKDFDHPSIQAHVRNGKFNGTIGMLARFGLALNTLGEMQADAAAAAEASAALAAELQALQYGFDPLNPTAPFNLDMAISQFQATPPADPIVAARISNMIATTPAAPDETAMLAAEGELTAAEDMMTAASNKAPWSEVRSVVIDRLGLADVTVTDPTAPTDPAAPSDPATPSDPAPVIDPVL
jgi:hypothetical protein